MSEPFFTPVGIEFGWLVGKTPRAPTNLLCASYVDIAHAESALWPKRLKPHAVRNDCSSIEISSPILRSYEHLREFWGTMNEMRNRLGLVAHRTDVQSAGGHVHAQIPKRLLQNPPAKLVTFFSRVFGWVYDRPWLNWLFNEWCDTNSAEHFCRLGLDAENGEGNWAAQILRGRRYLPIGRGYKDVLGSLDFAKRVPCRVATEYGTIEFRFFDAKDSLREAQLHVDFVQALMGSAFDGAIPLTKHDSDVPMEERIRVYAKLPPHEIWQEEIVPALHELGLSSRAYAPFFEKNYLRRREAGRLK